MGTEVASALNAIGKPYEVILIDTPATGHMLALTALPDLLLKLLPWGPIPEALREGQSYINDQAKGAAYVVTLPEQLPVTETLEIIAGLTETRIHVGGVIVNRMPQMTFSAAERAALEPMLERQKLFGAEGYYRAQWADRAVGRLCRESAAAIFTMAEEAAQGPELVAALAAKLPQRSQREHFAERADAAGTGS